MYTKVNLELNLGKEGLPYRLLTAVAVSGSTTRYTLPRGNVELQLTVKYPDSVLVECEGFEGFVGIFVGEDGVAIFDENFGKPDWLYAATQSTLTGSRSLMKPPRLSHDEMALAVESSEGITSPESTTDAAWDEDETLQTEGGEQNSGGLHTFIEEEYEEEDEEEFFVDDSDDADDDIEYGLDDDEEK